jgi:hypothetical protein
MKPLVLAGLLSSHLLTIPSQSIAADEAIELRTGAVSLKGAFVMPAPSPR